MLTCVPAPHLVVHPTVAELHLFWHYPPDHSIVPRLSSVHPALLRFIVLVEFAGPLLAQLYPDSFSNHFALRKYTGNHPFHIFLCRMSALHKLDRIPSARKLADSAKSLAELISKDSQEQRLATLATLVRGRLNTKPLPHLIERYALPSGANFSE